MNRKLASWLAIFGMVLNALWPLLANAGPVEFAMPVCSAVGTTASAGLAGTPLQPAPGKLSAPHCPFCTSASDHQPALPVAAALLLPPPAESLSPLLAIEPIAPSFTLLSAHPRGPPPLLI